MISRWQALKNVKFSKKEIKALMMSLCGIIISGASIIAASKYAKYIPYIKLIFYCYFIMFFISGIVIFIESYMKERKK